MAGEITNINTFSIPEENPHERRDQEAYWEGFDGLALETLGNEREERDYKGEEISERQLKKEAKENIRAFKAKKIGARGLSLSQFDIAA
ncbi:MAG: hypothetical protein ACK5MU_02885 [Candidatus Saccharimonadales bacterium]